MMASGRRLRLHATMEAPGTMLTSQAILKSGFELAHQVFQQVIDDVDPAILTASPGGTASSVAALLAHTVFSEDFMLNTMILGAPPLFTTGALDGTGLSAPDSPELGDALGAACAKMNLAAFRAYTSNVFAATEAAIGGMSDAQLAAEVETPLGKMPAGMFINSLLHFHVAEHAGEISAIKGIKGGRGFPF